jgi:nucleoid DNA-binding protein
MRLPPRTLMPHVLMSVRILATIIDTIGTAMRRGRKVQITGFVTFFISKGKLRKGGNPKTEEPI